MAIKFTNKHNLPQEFVDAITLDNHVVNGDISVTTLIDAPQVRLLRKTTDYEVDVTDQMAMFFGTAIHERLETAHQASYDARTLWKASAVLSKLGEEKGAKRLNEIVETSLKEKISDDVLTEQTLTIESNGWVVSGTVDRYIKSEKRLRDYKTITASALAFPEQKTSWKLQQNIYAAMLRAIGYEVEHIEIVAIVKDWSKMKLKSSKDYPQAPVVIIPLEVGENDKVLKYIDQRVLIHQRAEQGESIPCTKLDRWAKADTYAVKKKGGKNALRTFPAQKMAEAFVTENQFKYPPAQALYIEFRPAESFRCKNYCSMSSVCPQYKAELEATAEISEEQF
ncbi:MAG: PD-(D/E)XK nuclease family protein [Flavobacteriia bacterium]|jgi:hypothetical protein